MKLSGLKKVLIFSFALMMLISFVSTASATNGYFAHGYSVKSKGLGGAGTALPLDSLAAATNPAGMVMVGKRIDFGLSFFNPNREYTATGPGNVTVGNVDSDSDWFVIPSLGFNWMMNNDYSLGVSIYGNGGMNTDYNASTYLTTMPAFTASAHTGVDLSQLFVVPTYARKLNEKHAIGISPIMAYQRFEAKGLQPFLPLSTSPTNKLTNRGHDDSLGFGGRIGYLGEIATGLFLGASYQTKIWMDEYDDYAGLFAEQGDFDIPANWSVGLAYQATEDIMLALDVQQILYSDVDSIGNSFNPAFMTCALAGGGPSGSASCLGGDDGVGFGWDDMTIIKVGIEYKSSPEWTWRGGYSYGEQPIDSSEVLFNIIAPGVIEHHATAGFTRTIKGNQEISFAVMHAFENDVSGINPLASSQTIEIEMNQWEFTAGYAYKF